MADQTSTWEQVTKWRMVLPPSRPDTVDLRRIADSVASLDRAAPVGILGSTPEFRDLVYELGFRDVRVLEKTLSYYRMVTAERIHSSAETVVEGDWLETLPLQEDQYALLLSDLTSGNVAYGDRAQFYEAIEGALLPGGLFIDKILENSNGLLSLDDIERRYAFAPPNLQTVNYFSCEAIFCSELQAVGYIDTTRVYAQLEEAFTLPRFKHLIHLAQDITPPGCVWFYGVPWQRLSQDYCRGLEQLAGFQLNPGQPYHRRGHQYVWRKGVEDG